MAWKTWTAGDVLTAADINKQGPTLCTSATRPSGGNLYEGHLITETDTDRVLYYDGTGWVILSEPTQTYTPTATNITVGTGGTLTGAFKRSDGWMDLQVYAQLGSSGFSVTGNPIFSLPSGTPAIQPEDNVFLNQGGANVFDANGSLWYGGTYHDSFNGFGVVYLASATTPSGNTAPTRGGINATTPMTWAAGDYVHAWVRFQMSNRHSFT